MHELTSTRFTYPQTSKIRIQLLVTLATNGSNTKLFTKNTEINMKQNSTNNCHHFKQFKTTYKGAKTIRCGFTLGQGGAIAPPPFEPCPLMLVTAEVKTAFLEVGVVHS